MYRRDNWLPRKNILFIRSDFPAWKDDGDFIKILIYDRTYSFQPRIYLHPPHLLRIFFTLNFYILQSYFKAATNIVFGAKFEKPNLKET